MRCTRMCATAKSVHLRDVHCAEDACVATVITLNYIAFTYIALSSHYITYVHLQNDSCNVCTAPNCARLQAAYFCEACVLAARLCAGEI